MVGCTNHLCTAPPMLLDVGYFDTAVEKRFT